MAQWRANCLDALDGAIRAAERPAASAEDGRSILARWPVTTAAGKIERDAKISVIRF